MIIDGFLGDRLYSVTLDEEEYALFSELEEQREFANLRDASKAFKAAVEVGRTQGATSGINALRKTKAWRQAQRSGRGSKLYRKSAKARDQILDFEL